MAKPSLCNHGSRQRHSSAIWPGRAGTAANTALSSGSNGPVRALAAVARRVSVHHRGRHASPAAARSANRPPTDRRSLSVHGRLVGRTPMRNATSTRSKGSTAVDVQAVLRIEGDPTRLLCVLPNVLRLVAEPLERPEEVAALLDSIGHSECPVSRSCASARPAAMTAGTSWTCQASCAGSRGSDGERRSRFRHARPGRRPWSRLRRRQVPPYAPRARSRMSLGRSSRAGQFRSAQYGRRAQHEEQRGGLDTQDEEQASAPMAATRRGLSR